MAEHHHEHEHEHEHHHHFEMPQKSRMEEALSKYNLNITDEEVKEAVKDIIAPSAYIHALQKSFLRPSKSKALR